MIVQIIQEISGLWIVSTLMVILVIHFATKTKKSKNISPEIFSERLYCFTPKPLIDETLVPLKDEKIEFLQPDEKSPDCLNVAKINYLNLLNSNEMRNEAASCIKKYGVGACGPRGFYGTIDVHLRLESAIAEFMGMEEAVLYSYAFSTISSAIGAYCKRSDIIFCDEKISFASKQGFVAAKSKIVYFKHNDMEDLETQLKIYKQKEDERKNMFRKFLVVEGIYSSTGKICPLPELMNLREKYCLRIFIDESTSFGVLGKKGRGVTEHFNIDRSDVDMIIGSLEGALGSIGGFCVGASVVIEHQRLSGLGYCFSASLPPCLSEIATSALKKFERNPDVFSTLKEVSHKMNLKLSQLEQYATISDPESPLQVIAPKNPNNVDINYVHNYCTSQNLYLLKKDGNLQINVNIEMPEPQMDKICRILDEATSALA